MAVKAFSFYQVTVPYWIRGLNTLASILDKAITHSQQAGLKKDGLTNSTLSPDMQPFNFQVQQVINTAKNSLWRITGANTLLADDLQGPNPALDTLQALKERVLRTSKALSDIPREQVDGHEEKQVELHMGAAGVKKMTARQYCFNYGLPNFFFHLNMAYAILRAEGVPLKKTDYIMGFFGEDWQ